MGSGVEGWEVVIGSQCEVTKFQYYVRLDASLTIAVLTIATLTVATLTRYADYGYAGYHNRGVLKTR